VLEIDGIVQHISASAQEQSTGLSQINSTLNQMDQTVQQNAAMVEEAAAASVAMRGETETLSEIVGTFDLGSRAAAGRVPRHDASRPPAGSPAEQLQRQVATRIGATFAAGGGVRRG
jgi:methyl-accepting chemotaxis protein